MLQVHAEPDDRFRGQGDHRNQYLEPEAASRTSRRLIVMLLLFLYDACDGRQRSGVFPPQRRHLLRQMTEHYVFDSGGGRMDGGRSAKSGHNPKYEATAPAEPIAATARPTAALQLAPEHRAMSLLMRHELPQLGNEVRCGDASDRNLTRIDANRGVLASVIHLEYTIAKRFVRVEARTQRSGV